MSREQRELGAHTRIAACLGLRWTLRRAVHRAKAGISVSAVNGRMARLGVVGALAMVPMAIPAAPTFAALDRPALQIKVPERQILQASAKAGSRLVAVGERGIVVLSEDGGERWRQARNVPVSTTLTAVSFAPGGKGWAVGHGGVILHTTDGGESWVRQTEGVALAAAVLDAVKEALSRQPDSPKVAQSLKAAEILVADGADKPLLDVQFIDASNGWAVGAYSLAFQTQDGGKTWRYVGDRLDNPKGLHLYAIRVLGEKVLIVGEQGQMHRSEDGGRSFESIASPYKGSLFSLSMSPGGEVIATGLQGNAFYSVDFGREWRRIQGLPSQSVVGSSFLRDGVALIGTQAGELFISRAGAAATRVAASPLPLLGSLLVLDGQSALLTGLGGVARISGLAAKN